MIGVFDSGVGGLSVLLELVRLMPEQDYVYVADTRYCPYGPKSVDVIRERSSVISQFLIDKGAEVVVVACNTATAASVSLLRSAFPVPFVGMEPAIKPAAALSRSGVVGVLATANTFNGSLYHHTRDTYATEVTVIERVGEGLVELVEQGQLEGPQTEAVVRRPFCWRVPKQRCVQIFCRTYPLLDVMAYIFLHNRIFRTDCALGLFLIDLLCNFGILFRPFFLSPKTLPFYISQYMICKATKRKFHL